MQSRDYIERLIAQVVEAIGRALGLAHSGRQDEARSVLDALWSAAIGVRRSDAERLDETTLRSLLGAKRSAAASLLDAEADIEHSRGNSASATRLRALARALRD